MVGFLKNLMGLKVFVSSFEKVHRYTGWPGAMEMFPDIGIDDPDNVLCEYIQRRPVPQLPPPFRKAIWRIRFWVRVGVVVPPPSGLLAPPPEPHHTVDRCSQVGFFWDRIGLLRSLPPPQNPHFCATVPPPSQGPPPLLLTPEIVTEKVLCNRMFLKV